MLVDMQALRLLLHEMVSYTVRTSPLGLCPLAEPSLLSKSDGILKRSAALPSYSSPMSNAIWYGIVIMSMPERVKNLKAGSCPYVDPS